MIFSSSNGLNEGNKLRKNLKLGIENFEFAFVRIKNMVLRNVQFIK